MAVYKKLVNKMEQNQVTFADLASQLTVSKQTLTKKMKGELDFTFDEIIQIAKILEIDDVQGFFF